MGLIQDLVDQPQHHGRGMDLPVLLRSDSNVGDPTRRSIDPRRCMADDTNVGLGDQMNPVILFDLVEEYAVRPCLAVCFDINLLESCNVGLLQQTQRAPIHRSTHPWVKAHWAGLVCQLISASGRRR